LADAVPRIHGGSRAVGIMGWPVSHSLSPAMHNAAFAALGLGWVYVPLPVAPGALAEALAGLRSLGFAGANVTMPHKTEAAERITVLSEDARRLNAVNTIVVEGDELRGHNTDGEGFARFLLQDAGFDPAGRSALIFGSGGAARATALALARAGLATLSVAARDPARTAGLVAALDGLPTEVRSITVDACTDTHPDLVINATPVGASGEDLPVPPLGPGQLYVDLMYHPSVTPLQMNARRSGAAAFGGLGMLLHQAALSFELWTGVPAPLEVMSAAALAELAEHA
jgi:shikimate dehydrogenase